MELTAEQRDRVDRKKSEAQKLRIIRSEEAYNKIMNREIWKLDPQHLILLRDECGKR
jgi:hypothetical protein